MDKTEELIKILQSPPRMQLYMGELNKDELLAAQAAVRYTVTQLIRGDALKVENIEIVKDSNRF